MRNTIAKHAQLLISLLQIISNVNLFSVFIIAPDLFVESR